MPQCPHCKTEYDKGQRYCQVCGSFLLHPVEGDTFCPQCGIRVSHRQVYCHECDAPLKEEAGAVATEEAAPAAAPAEAKPEAAGSKMQPWVLGLLVGAGILVIILMILLFSRSATTPPAPPPPAPKAAAPPAATPAPAPKAETPAPPPAAAPTLKDQLQEALTKLREAQLNKDILTFMALYSLTFPGLEQKRRNTLKNWELYDYNNMVFTVEEVQKIDADNALATVTWYIDARNRRTQELGSAKQTYQVRFAKEMGAWKIRSLEEVE